MIVMALLPGFTLLGEFPDLNFVAVLETRLNDAGIEYVLLNEGLTSLAGRLYGPVYGGVRVLVRDDQVDGARLLLE
jgi:hypothetical protein